MTEETIAERRERRMRHTWRAKSNVPIRYVASDLRTLSWPGTELVSKWLTRALAGDVVNAPGSRLCGRGLLLDGPPGAGKSTLAASVALNLVYLARPEIWAHRNSVRPVYMERMDGLLRAQQRLFDRDFDVETQEFEVVIRGLVGEGSVISVLIVDDVGKEYKTEWAGRIFENMIRSRYDLGLPTIVTTNVPLLDWAKVYGDAVYSFAHEAFLHVPMMSPTGDRRRE